MPQNPPFRAQLAALLAYRRSLLLGFSIALMALTIYFVMSRSDERTLQLLLATQNRSLLFSAALLVFVQNVVAGERWRTVLAASAYVRLPSLLSVQVVFYASLFFNNLPLGSLGGDVARVWLGRRFGLPVSQLALSVLLDRILTVLALIVLAVLTLPTIAHPLILAPWLGSAALLAGFASFVFLLPVVERILDRWQGHRVVFWALRGAREFRLLRQSAGIIGLCWALLSTIASAGSAYCIARSLDIQISPVTMIAVISVVALVTALPISFAGWGVREASVVSLLALLRIDREAALLLSVEFGLLSMAMSLPGGIIWLVLRERRDAQVSSTNQNIAGELPE